jgi:hypothetical protein
MKYLAVIFSLIAGVAIASEHWIVQLPITTVGTNTTVVIDSPYANKGIVKGWYIDVSGSEAASFTGTVSAVHSSKGVRTLASAQVATVAAPFVTNGLALNLFDEILRLSIVSPATATNSVTVNAVFIYQR